MFVELLSRDQHLKTRHRFDTLPISIGRGYQNDLIIDDPYLDAQHAMIEMAETGELCIRDLSAENGLIYKGKRIKEAMLGDALIHLGHSHLRVRHAGFQVEKTLTDKRSLSWEGWPAAIVGMLLIVFSSLVEVWLSASEKFSYVTAITAVALVLTLVLIWCGGWAFATRTIGNGASRFGQHIFIVACATVLLNLWDIVSITLAYAFSLEFLALYGSHVAMAIVAGMLFFHLLTVNSLPIKRFKIICVALSFIGSGFILINNYQSSSKFTNRLYMPYLLPPVLRLTNNQNIDTFLEGAKDLKPELDEMRQKPANTSRDFLGE